MFQSAAPVDGGDTRGGALPQWQRRCFNTRAPVMGATVPAGENPSLRGCFNPRPRDGGDRNSPADFAALDAVSIRAP